MLLGHFFVISFFTFGAFCALSCPCRSCDCVDPCFTLRSASILGPWTLVCRLHFPSTSSLRRVYFPYRASHLFFLFRFVVSLFLLFFFFLVDTTSCCYYCEFNLVMEIWDHHYTSKQTDKQARLRHVNSEKFRQKTKGIPRAEDRDR